MDARLSDGVIRSGDINHLEDDMLIYGKEAAAYIAETMDRYVSGQYVMRVNIKVDWAEVD